MKGLLLFIALSLISTASFANNYEESCRKGKFYNCDSAAFAYEVGKGVRQDSSKAVELYGIGCNGGDLSSCTGLAVQYFEGKGVPKDINRAIKIHMDTCLRSPNAGSASGSYGTYSCLYLGQMYKNGKGVPKNKVLAKNWLGLACDKKMEAGCEEYAKINRN